MTGQPTDDRDDSAWVVAPDAPEETDSVWDAGAYDAAGAVWDTAESEDGGGVWNPPTSGDIDAVWDVPGPGDVAAWDARESVGVAATAGAPATESAGPPGHARGPGTGDTDLDPPTARLSRGSAPRGRARGGRRGAAANEPPESGPAGVDAEPDPESVARSIALRLLTGAPRSRAQLAEAMAKREVPEDVAERVLDRFAEVGLVDDAAYAEVLVRSRHVERGLSRRALAMELRRRGVDDTTAHEALAQVDDEDEERAARTLARRKLAATRGLDRETRMRRAYGALGRKGYGGSLVSRVVREELAAEGDSDVSPDDWADRLDAD